MTAPGLALIRAVRLALLLLLPVIRAESISGLLGRTLSSTDKKYIDILKSIVPYDYAAFLNSNYQGSRLSQSKDIIMVEVDMQSSELLTNSIVSLRLANSHMQVYANSYDPIACKVISSMIPCYYNDSFVSTLNNAFVSITGKAISKFQPMQRVQMGRLMLSTIALCEGYNVFVTDSDVVYYSDPLNYIGTGDDITIQATELTNRYGDQFRRKWGFVLLESSISNNTFFTLNSGVCVYRSSRIVLDFMIHQSVYSLKYLETNFRENGYLQITFNNIMRELGLVMRPSNKMSARDINCDGIYTSAIDYSSPLDSSGPRKSLIISTFPLRKLTSNCNKYDGFDEAIINSANSMRQLHRGVDACGDNNTTHSSVFATHANCIRNYAKKKEWLVRRNSWFVENL